MATLGGHFAMMLIVALGDGTPGELEGELARAVDDDLIVAVRPVAEAATGGDEGEPYVVSVYGADHPGIVARVAGLLAEHHINISDAATHVLPGDPPVYVMVLEVGLPGDADAGGVETALKSLGAELSVDVSMHPMEPDTL